eukprot:5627456-Alexandrium_andersonii.AAC.1
MPVGRGPTPSKQATAARWKKTTADDARRGARKRASAPLNRFTGGDRPARCCPVRGRAIVGHRCSGIGG